jgi:outer membrane lipoprotein-sorting protein
MKKIFFVSFLYFVFALTARANFESSYQKLNKTNRYRIDKANTYFDLINTFKSNFLQFNENDSSMSEGIIYVEKPDKIRFEYTNPFNTIFIKNKGIINYYDVDLDELMVVPQSVSPIFKLLSQQPNLRTLNSSILSVENDSEGNILINTEATLDTNKVRILYIFDGQIQNLIGLNIDTGEVIELSFFDTTINQNIDRKKFVFDNPRLFNNRRTKDK